ncbi:hypothetical protein FQA39_LY09384 [Lamprigera yunnana]|nr:hypothetical protein FQA39_LY09384 [Lamprigera yunnana]
MQKEKSLFAKENWWKRRSRFEKKLLIAFLLVIVVFGAFVAIVMVRYVLARQPCSTDRCILAASHVISSIDPSVDPCEDFFKFACGRFIQQIHGDIKATSVSALEEEVERQIAELIKEPIKKDDHHLVKTQKKIFQNCMNETEEEQSESLVTFNETLRELHGWPVVEGFVWNEQLFDWKDMMYKLKRKGYPYEFFLEISILPDLQNKSQNVVYISEPFLMLVKKKHKDYYKQYMVDIAVGFGADENLATIDMEKVFDLGERIEKIIEQNRYKAENQTESSFKTHLLSRRFTIEEYQKQYTNIDWLSFINNILKPSAKISKNDYVYFANDELLKKLLTLYEKTPRRIQANYIIWNVVERMISYLSKDLQQLESNYICQTSRVTPSKDKLKYCKRIINTSFRPSPLYINYARKYLPAEKRHKVQEMLHSVKFEFLKLLRETSWMDEESKENAYQKAKSMIKIIGTPGDYFDDSIYDSFGSGPQFPEDIENYNYLEILLINSKYLNDFSFSKLNKINDNSSNEFTYHWVIATVNAMYSLEDNAMILPVAILQGIFYDPDRPQYLNYGSLGSIIGHELTHGFCEEASKYDKNDEENYMWTNETAEAFQEKIQCIIKDAEEFDVQDTESTINGTLTLEENIADYTGVKVAYAAYRNWVRENGEESPLTGIDYTPNQLFWIASISHECYELSGKTLEKILKRDSHALNVFRAIAPLQNSEEFAKDFNCPLNSVMNPENKCKIF